MKYHYIFSLFLSIFEIIFNISFVYNFDLVNFSEKLLTHKNLIKIVVSLACINLSLLFLEIYGTINMKYGLFSYTCILFLRSYIIYLCFVLYYRVDNSIAMNLILLYFQFRFVLHYEIRDEQGSFEIT